MTYIDYLMLTPLDEEWRFVKDVLVKKPFEGSEDSITYYRWQHVCSKNQKRGQYLMVAAPMGKMGLANAANFAATALHTWNPKHVVLLGIAGSLVGEELPLGDVIVPYHTFGYEVAEVNEDAGCLSFTLRRTGHQLGALLWDRVRAFAKQ